MIVASGGEDIVYTNLFTGVHGNYLRPSIVAAGLDPDDLPQADPSKMNFGAGGNQEAKAWRDIWGCGQGIGAVKHVPTAGELVARLAAEYEAAKAELAGKTAFTAGAPLATSPRSRRDAHAAGVGDAPSPRSPRAISTAADPAGGVPAAIYTDHDHRQRPPRRGWQVLHIPSGGVKINGVAYVAAGGGLRTRP